MTKRYYDIEDENFKSVIKSLKELPHISAPPDFEMNLRRKLNSLEAASKKEKKSRMPLFAFLPGGFGLRKVLVPAGALAATVVIAFLVFNPKNSEVENPFTTAPQVRSQSQQNAPKENLLINPGEISSTDVVVKKNAPKALSESGRKLSSPEKDSEQMALNDRLLRRIRELNMQDENTSSGDIDRSLREKPSPNGAAQYGNGANTVNFEGFNIYQEGDRSLDMLRARMDSIRRVMRSRR